MPETTEIIERCAVAILKRRTDDRSVAIIKCSDGTFVLSTILGSGEDAVVTQTVFTEKTLLMILQVSIVGLEYFGSTMAEAMNAHGLIGDGVYEFGGCGELKLGRGDGESVPAAEVAAYSFCNSVPCYLLWGLNDRGF